MRVLGIETSCDECSAAVVDAQAEPQPFARVLQVSTYSQIRLHQPFGGVVPEVASRNHLETINAMIDNVMRSVPEGKSGVDAIAVTNRPGLVGALLVGVSAAKALAYAWKKPLFAVHHLEGHLASLFLDRAEGASPIQYPLTAAVVSGGHTHLHVLEEPPHLWKDSLLRTTLVGRSRDDAAGEAFDKTAKLLGFPYPGGAWIDRGAKGGDAAAFAFPRALPQRDSSDFSFSGLKTAVALEIERQKRSGLLKEKMADLCASIQEAIVDALLRKIFAVTRARQCRSIAIVGGVAANSRLRERLEKESPVPFFAPSLKYCSDNAAMIAAAGGFRALRQGAWNSPESRAFLSLNALPYAET